MADKRMFARGIVESAKFLKMPPSTQNLYFHLALNADDDGIVEAYSVINLVKANEDDLRILFSKGFVTILNEDLVTYIQDWRIHNTLRADRKKDSIYQQLLLSVLPETQLLEKRKRSDTKQNGHTVDGPWAAQNSVVENSVDKNRLEECKISLGHERLTHTEYNGLVSRYNSEIVDEIINRIIEHPYYSCLNVSTITKWCEEAKEYSAMTNKKNNRFNSSQRQEYDFAKIEQLLEVNRQENGVCV
ncbi:MAG: hypothetical protein IJO85_06775 [Lachnospiraceae bacterium]|nr:hypothetical protein [Lachnospiraceae bacterium]